MTASMTHPAHDRQVSARQRDQLGYLEPEQPARADHDEGDTLIGQEQAQRDDEGRYAHPRDEEAYERAGGEPDEERDEERDHPVPPVRRDEHDEDRHRDAARDAGRQIDLAEQQHEHERHAQHDERRRLIEQVGEVAVREEERAQDREQDAEHDQSADRGQRTHVAAAHALEPSPDLIAQAAFLTPEPIRPSAGRARGVLDLRSAHAVAPDSVDPAPT